MKQPTADIHFKVAGYFKMEAHQQDEAGAEIPGSRRHLAEFQNLITDNGLELMKDGAHMIRYISVGSGSTAPAFTDTQLVARIATAGYGSAPAGGTYNSTDKYCDVTISIQFGQGAAAGNLSEVGIGAGSTGLNLFSRSLIKDGAGNPTTITVLAIEFLTVTYTLRLYFDTADTTGSFTIGGTTYNTITRCAVFDSNPAWIWNYFGGCAIGDGGNLQTYASTSVLGAAGSGAPSGSSGTGSTTWTKTNGPVGSYYADIKWDFTISQGNATGGVGAVYHSSGRSWGRYKTSFTPPLPKDNTKTMSLTFRFSWSRY